MPAVSISGQILDGRGAADHQRRRDQERGQHTLRRRDEAPDHSSRSPGCRRARSDRPRALEREPTRAGRVAAMRSSSRARQSTRTLRAAAPATRSTTLGTSTITAITAAYTRLAASSRRFGVSVARSPHQEKRAGDRADTERSEEQAVAAGAHVAGAASPPAGSSAHSALPGTRNSAVRSSMRRIDRRIPNVPCRPLAAPRRSAPGAGVDASTFGCQANTTIAYARKVAALMAKTAPTPIRAMSTPAIAGPIGASEVDADRSQR